MGELLRTGLELLGFLPSGPALSPLSHHALAHVTSPADEWLQAPIPEISQSHGMVAVGRDL